VDVAVPVVAALRDQGWKVYQEVAMPGGGEADIVGVMDVPGRVHPLIRIVEVKTSLSLRVVEQAVKHVVHGGAHYVSVAVPASGRGTDVLWAPGKSVLREVMAGHGVGLLTVDLSSPAWIPDPYRVAAHRELPGRLARWSSRIDRKGWLHQLRKARELIAKHEERNPAGSPSLGKSSPYRDTMDGIRDFLARRGEATLDDILRAVRHHYSNDRSARSTIPGRLLRVEAWCEAERREGMTWFRIRGTTPAPRPTSLAASQLAQQTGDLFTLGGGDG
jgi:hypothetical protein